MGADLGLTSVAKSTTNILTPPMSDEFCGASGDCAECEVDTVKIEILNFRNK